MADALRARAGRKGISLEEEVRGTLAASVEFKRQAFLRRAKAIRTAIGGKAARKLAIFARASPKGPPEFSALADRGWETIPDPFLDAAIPFADPHTGMAYAYVTNRMGGVAVDPRDVALRNALPPALR